jgi:hypothetical protein
MSTGYRDQLRNLLPEGAIPVGTGLAVAGVATYGFLALTARALGPARYSSFSGFWAVLFLIAPAVFMAFEQQLACMVAARGTGDSNCRSAVAGSLRLQISVA